MDPPAASALPVCRFVVPTPAGPVRLTDLVPRKNVGTSAVFLKTHYSHVQPLSSLYNDFVHPHGPVGFLLRPQTDFLLLIDTIIDTGRSWEFAVLLLHALAAGQLTAARPGDDRPVLVWASGVLAFDPTLPLDAQPLDAGQLHLADKIEASRALLEAEARAGCRIVALVPATDEGRQAAAVLTALLAGWQATVATCATIGAARSALAGAGPAIPAPPTGSGTIAGAPADPAPAGGAGPAGDEVRERATDDRPAGSGERDGGSTGRRARALRVAGITLGIVVAAAAAAHAIGALWPEAPPDTRPPITPAVSAHLQPEPDVVVIGLYLPPGSDCGVLAFAGDARPRREAARRLPDGAGFALPLANLCGLDLQPRPGTELLVSPALRTGFLQADPDRTPGPGWIRLVVRPQAAARPVLPMELDVRDRQSGAPGAAPVRLVPAAPGRAGLP